MMSVMSINLRIGLFIVSLLLIVISIISLRRGRMPVKYSLVWVFSSIIILLISVIPSFFVYLSKLAGFETMSNMVIGIFIFILLMITMILTIIVSSQKKKLTLLVQEISILKEKVNKNEK